MSGMLIVITRILELIPKITKREDKAGLVCNLGLFYVSKFIESKIFA